MIGQLGADLEDAIAEVRSLAAGIYPPVLADFGLAEALRALARPAPVSARVAIDGTERCRPEVEAAVYFCCSEALHNAAQHAGVATTVSISLKRHRDLHFAVHDDGTGFSLPLVRSGQGLANMRDRIEAVGGTLDIRSAPGRGTSVVGTIPDP
jgi:signal transduction histidine kinase